MYVFNKKYQIIVEFRQKFKEGQDSIIYKE